MNWRLADCLRLFKTRPKNVQMVLMKTPGAKSGRREICIFHTCSIPLRGLPDLDRIVLELRYGFRDFDHLSKFYRDKQLPLQNGEVWGKAVLSGRND